MSINERERKILKSSPNCHKNFPALDTTKSTPASSFHDRSFEDEKNEQEEEEEEKNPLWVLPGPLAKLIEPKL